MKTIKIFIVVLALVAIVDQVHAQAQVSLGIKGGLNFAKLDVNQSVASNYESRTGYHAGAFMLFKLTKIGIQPELIFSRQGTKYQLNSQNLEANFDYINIPILFKLYTVAGINLQIGPQFGFLSKAQAQQVVNGAVTNTDVKSLYKNSDTSIAMGVGWDLPLGITLDARYNLGIKDISDSSTPQTKNQVFQISVGYKLIKLGK
jgi:hypothetical protein